MNKVGFEPLMSEHEIASGLDWIMKLILVIF